SDTFLCIDRLLRVLGLALLVTLVVILPVSTFSYGIAALIRSVVVDAELLVTLVVVARFALRHLGAPWPEAARRAAPLLSPFTAPRATEVLCRAALEPDASDVGALIAARAALGEEHFAVW